MKKTMLALMATVGLAFIAKAVNTTGFEGYTGDFAYDKTDVGADMGDRYWVVTNTTPEDLSGTVLATYDDESAKPVEMPWAFTNTANNTYLKVDTSNEVLYRSVEAVDAVNALNAGTAIDDGLYFDANVQFTASDGEPTPAEGDKLIVWLSGDDEAGTTNLVVTATETYLLNKSQGPVNFTNNNANISIKDSEWHRLTVAAANENDTTTFKVYIDGELVTAEGASDGKFKSLVGKGDSSSTYATLAAVGFQGTGALDNLVWTTDDPFPAPVVDDVALTIDLTDDDAVFAGLAANAEPVDVAEPDPIVATVDDVITFVAKVPDGYTPTVEGYDLQKSDEKDEDDNYAYTFTVTVTQEMIANGLTLTINVTADGGGEEVPESGEAEPGKSATVKAKDEAAAEAAVSVKVDATVAAALTTEQKDAFVAAFFNKTVTDNGDGTFTVSVEVDEDAVENVLDDVIEEALETASDGEITTIPAGLCYKIESGSTVGLGTMAKGVSTGAKIEVDGLSDAAGFYKVTLDVKPIE